MVDVTVFVRLIALVFAMLIIAVILWLFTRLILLFLMLLANRRGDRTVNI